MRLVWTARALADVEEIYQHAAMDKPVAARKLAERLLLAGNHLVQHPFLGRVVRPNEVRELVVGKHLMLYRVREARNAIEVISVTHGARKRT